MQNTSPNQQRLTQASIEEVEGNLFEENCTYLSHLISQLNSLDAERSSQNSYYRQFQFLEKQASLCVILNAKAEIVYLNSCGCELLGVDKQDYYGQCWLTQYVLPDQRTELAIVFEQMMKGFGEPFSRYCNEVHTHLQNNVTLEWQNYILRNSHNVILGTFSVGTQLGLPS